MSIIDEHGELKYRVVSRPDEPRTARSVMLRPGSYEIRVNVRVPLPLQRRRRIQSLPTFSYQIFGIGISDPTGPEVIDPLEDPFSPCDKNSNDFCYPNDRHSPDPFIFVEEDEIDLPPSSST